MIREMEKRLLYHHLYPFASYENPCLKFLYDLDYIDCQNPFTQSHDKPQTNKLPYIVVLTFNIRPMHR